MMLSQLTADWNTEPNVPIIVNTYQYSPENREYPIKIAITMRNHLYIKKRDYSRKFSEFL